VSVFEDIELEWDGEQYVIPASRVMRLVQTIEDIVTISELQECIQRMKAGKVSAAYGAMLRFAGAKVTDEEVYSRIFESSEDMNRILVNSGLILYNIICPPSAFAKKKTAKKKVAKKKPSRKKAKKKAS